ncbi:MAG: ATP-binding protein [Acidobacteria bacterium]|nr:ATP-binding protein [Acidobacteriota bacterium]
MSPGVIQRSAVPQTRAAAAERPVVLVTGPRQAGKTTLLRQAFPHLPYISLDLPHLAEQAEESGLEFLRPYHSLILDEVQYAPKMFRYLKHRVDQDRARNGQFLLTGSQKFGLMAGVSESLAGRVAVLELQTLSLRELEHHTGKRAEGDQLLEWMVQGGYPEIHARGLDPYRFYADYVATYLERDVRQVIEVRNLRDFDRFLRLAASRTGQLVSYQGMAGELGLSPNTLKAWLGVLEASSIIRLVEPYYQNFGKRMTKTPKLYFMDTGLACFLTGLHSPDVLHKSTFLGPMFETLVLGQMVRAGWNQGRPRQIYFYRDYYGTEVDFVIPEGEKLRLYECKWSEMVSRESKGFHALRELAGKENILSATYVTPLRGKRRRGSFTIADCVDLLWEKPGRRRAGS